MKAKEIEDGKVLMIGDLVIGCIETDIVGEATYKILCKVTGINHYGDVECEALEPFPDDLDWQDGDDFSWIEPIPITPEILEKNGWVSKRDGSGDFIYMRENTPGYGSNDMTVTKNIIGNFQMIHGSFNGISVHYVHEL